MKIYCLTYAGGNSSFYDQIEKYFPAQIKLVKIEYSGHGTRHKEPFYNNFSELAYDIYNLIKTDLAADADKKYAIFGYSMGSISALEVLRRIDEQGELCKPMHMFLAAHEPHTKEELAGYAKLEEDELVKERTIRFGAVPEQLINNNSFWRMYLPIYRADYGIIAQYCFNDLNYSTSVPATIFYSETDTPLVEMRKWANIFICKCDFVEYVGTHFFIRNHSKEMADVITERMMTDCKLKWVK